MPPSFFLRSGTRSLVGGVKPALSTRQIARMRVLSTTAHHHGESLLIGCAGWSLPGAAQENFPTEGSHLERYATVLPAVEINTSFYRPHRPATYARWRASVPPSFRFSVKVPKVITHELRLDHVDEPLMRFIDEMGHLEEKLGCLLVQLPPSLRYDPAVAERFFDQLRARVEVDVVCEPRHASWFTTEAERMLAAAQVAYVNADPDPVGQPRREVNQPVVYFRLHGSPVIYHSVYSEQYLDRLSFEIEDKLREGKRVWCIFDNTASGAAVPNALSLAARFGFLAPAVVQP
jgi:uncharacterized protein YecE (DUF72 family)